ncbi:glucan endo-1,3-beta-glucosidase [Actinidia eriantha]|uniref:glucan endo-1,3-beta-glucosidase n=1 Tax=Actinidia eriantha TaxID=165200 RepID=UPI00258E5B04|nr:glucan endo-1,3-beta-glucosidase [Actinidia eriantha]
MYVSLSTSLLSLLLLSLLLPATASLPPTIGVTYTPSSRPPPERVASALQSLKVAAVRLPDPYPEAVRAFSYSNISLLLTVPNSLVPSFAANRSAAALWLYTHVVPFYPRARISAVSVGSDPLVASPDLSSLLLPAIRNLHHSLSDLGIRKIAVSTTFSFISVMTTAFPPSAAEFQSPASDIIIRPLLDFLAETNSSFMIHLYPYNVYKLDHEIPIGFALFQEHPFNFRDDRVTGVRYRNLFDVMVDAVISAMAVAGHENIPVVVAETGWPSSGDGTDPDASKIYADMYIKGLMGHLRSGIGTPLRKEGVAETYIYELFDGDEKQGNETRRGNWGIMYPNMTKKFDIDFSAAPVGIGGGGLVAMALGLVLAVGVLLWQ